MFNKLDSTGCLIDYTKNNENKLVKYIYVDIYNFNVTYMSCVVYNVYLIFFLLYSL